MEKNNNKWTSEQKQLKVRYDTIPAIFPMVVVFPIPLAPITKITVGSLDCGDISNPLEVEGIYRSTVLIHH
jgi:hypothetical protein